MSSRSRPTVARIRHAGSLFVGPWAPESAGDYATGANHVLPTGGLARRTVASAVEAFGRFTQVQRITREGLAGIRDTVGTLAEAEGLLAHRRRRRLAASTRRPADEPDPGDVSSRRPRPASTPGRRRTRPSRRATASRSTQIVRFDLNTSPDAAGARRPPAGRGPLRDAALRVPAIRLPTADRRRGRTLRRATRRDRSSAPAPTRSSTSSARRSCQPVAPRVIPMPDLRDVPRPHRAAWRSRRSPSRDSGRTRAGRSTSTAIRSARPAEPPRSSGCAAPNNPTALPEPDGAIATLLEGLAGDATPPTAPGRRPAADRRPRRGVRRVRRPRRCSTCATDLPAPRRHPDREQGVRPGRPPRRVRDRPSRLIETINPYRPPGSVSTMSVTLVTEALLDPAILEANLARVAAERERLRTALHRGRLAGRAVRHELPARRPRDRRALRLPPRKGSCARARAAHVPCGPSAGGLPPPDGPRPRRERPTARCRAGRVEREATAHDHAARRRSTSATRPHAGHGRSARRARPTSP